MKLTREHTQEFLRDHGTWVNNRGLRQGQETARSSSLDSTFSCPNCGNVTDLKKVRSLMRDAQV